MRIAIDRIVMYIKDEDPSDIRDYFLWLKNMFKVELKEIELDSIRNLMGVKPMLAELVEKIEKDNIRKGIRRGKREGIAAGKLQTASKMLAKGFSIEEISELTELPVEKIESLR